MSQDIRTVFARYESSLNMPRALSTSGGQSVRKSPTGIWITINTTFRSVNRISMLLLQQIINGLMLGGVYVMVAVAFTLTIGMLNFLNFTIPALFMVSAMFFWATTSGGFGSGFDQALNAVIPANYQWLVGIVIALGIAMLLSLVLPRSIHSFVLCREDAFFCFSLFF